MKRGWLILIGPSGSGKTAIAKRVADQPGWRLYDTDAEILRRTGAQTIGEIFDQNGEAFFRKLELECLDEIGTLKPPVVVATGGGLPAIDGVMQELNALGVCVYVRASVATLWMRLNIDPRHLEDRPLLRAGGRDALAAQLEEREAIYSEAAMIVDTDQLTVSEISDLLVEGGSALLK